MTAAIAATERPRLKREIGPWMATALVIGNMIGSRIFLLPASLAGEGSVSIIGWIFTAIAIAFVGYAAYFWPSLASEPVLGASAALTAI